MTEKANMSHDAGDVTISHSELAQFLAVATMYVDAFQDGELMTLPEKLALQDVEALLEKYGRRY